MAGGAFDPAEFAAFKAQGAPPAPTSSSSGFDPDEFKAFKATRPSSRQSGMVPNPMLPDDGRAPAASFNDRFSAATPSSREENSTPLGEGLRAKADEMLVGKPDGVNQAAAALIRGSNMLGLNIPRAGGALVASLPGIGNGQTYAENYALAKDQEDALARQFPKTAIAGSVAGLGAGAVVLPGFQAAKGAGLAGQALAAAGTGAAYGTAGALLDANDAGEVGKQALIGTGIGAGIGAVAAPVVGYVGRGVEALARSPYFARGGAIENGSGELKATARAVLAQAGIDPTQITPELQAQIAQAFARKGESVPVAREAMAGEFGIPLSRGQATGDERALALEQAALGGARGSRAQTVGRTFADQQAEAIEAARQRLADRAGRGVQIENPTQAAEIIADQAREFATRQGGEAEAAQRAAEEALARLRGPDTGDALDAGASVAQGLRGVAGQRKAAYQGAYDDVAAIPGEFTPGALDRIGGRVRDRLPADVPVDPVLTPFANKALTDLDNLPELFRTQPGSGPTLGQVEQVRKRLGVYYGGTAQNPTDRRALNAIRTEFDRHVGDAAEAGLFGAPRAAQEAADAFPGAVALDAITGRATAAGGAPEAKSEPLTHYLARNGGIALDGDARAGDLGRVLTPYGPLGRKAGRPIEDFRDQLASEGFLRPDGADGMISRRIGDEVHDLIGIERSGNPVYRLSDISRGGAPADVGGRIADQSAAAAERMAPFRQQVTDDLASVGIHPRDVDPGHLDDAAQRLFRREHDTGADAYEAAVMAREPAGGGRASSLADDIPFDGPTAQATSTALPGATPDVVDKLRRARDLFSAYRKDFSPAGAGDDVGLAMRRIVDRDAEPVEVARMLYAGNPGMNARIADRVKGIVGEGSETWAAHQQGYLSSILNGRDMAPAAVSRRIEDALSGQRRGLTYRVLSDDQVRGLREFQTTARTAQTARDGVPEWIATLGRTDFDPNRITGDLFGSGLPGSRPGSAAYARSLKRFVGEDSAEWSGLRQAAWRRLVEKPDGSAGLPPREMAKRIMEFTSGKGSGLAKAMFSPEELAEFRRFGNAVQTTVTADGKALPNGGGVGGKIAAKSMDAITTALGFHLGGFAGAGAAYTGRYGTRLLQDGVQARAARQSFQGGAPRLAPPVIRRDLRPVGVGAGLSAQELR